MTSVSANLVLTGRKAASLCLSVWWFDSQGWNCGMTIGATLVFCGSMMYGIAGKGGGDENTVVNANGHANRNGNGTTTKAKTKTDQASFLTPLL